MGTRTRLQAIFTIPVFLALSCVAGMLFIRPVSAGVWQQAERPRQWSFPRDHGSHGEYRTEWWYFTGNLTDKEGKRYGYQLTFFRHGLAARAKDPAGPWSVRDVYLAHFTITDASRKTFHFFERISRRGPGLAGAGQEGMDVHVLNWSATMKDGRVRLYASHDGMELSLGLSPVKPLVLHGPGGLSRKGPKAGQASYYYSFTNLRTEGAIRTPAMTNPVPVHGTSWFDQEFGSNQLAKDQAGWDWFALHLSDGRDLMMYYLRKKDGTFEKESSGTLVEPDGTSRHLVLAEIRTDILSRWTSKRTAGRYPAAWRIRVPSASIDVTASPLLADQELVTKATSGITYWEGAIAGGGTSRGKEVSVEGYAELTGYTGALGGVF